MSATSYLRKKVMDHIFGVATYTVPSPLYLSLHSVDPGESGSHSNEITTVSSGYTRKSLAGLMTSPDPTTGLTVNNAEIIIGPALIPWNVVAIAIEDASSAGNMLWVGVPSVTKIVATGSPFLIPPGQLRVKLT